MHEIARVTLGNEMDLILAHKRSMKLAELAGLSLSSQTTFATAVSEVARTSIDSGKPGTLVLNVAADARDKYIVACLRHDAGVELTGNGLEYARRLVDKFNLNKSEKETSIELFYAVSPLFRIDVQKRDEWRSFFRNEPPVSAYEELKRKTEQLQDLSQKVQKSEAEYKTLTNTLPLVIFSMDKQGEVLYANEWLTRFSGQSVETLNRSAWKSLVHEDDYESFTQFLKTEQSRKSGNTLLQVRIKSRSENQYYWHQVLLTPFNGEDGHERSWIGYMVDINTQKQLEETLRDNIELKNTQALLRQVQEEQERNIEELNRSNLELQQFAFIASHDLQEPVRKLLYYSDYLINHHASDMEGRGLDYLMKTNVSANRMRVLIKDLLVFSQINREEVSFGEVDLNRVAKNACQDFEMAIEEKKAKLRIDELPVIQADEQMMQQLFENMISNSLKYAKKNQAPEIEISCRVVGNKLELSFCDNGIGFDEKYLDKMFTLFQRLHNRSEYEGTGLGLAICKKIVDFHAGKIWAKSKEEEGATFFVELPIRTNN